MGKWTPNYYDDILGVKLRRLAAGAIKRSHLEKSEPSITYEAFIEELEEGDGFTASLFDILVKEVAERRARHNPFNRHLIAEQTAINLRALAAPSRIHRDRARVVRHRSRYTLSEYLAGTSDDVTVEAEPDDFDSMMDAGFSAVEGTRVDSELHDAPRSSQSNTAASTVGDDNSERFFPETLLSRSPPSSYSQLRHDSQNSEYSSTRSSASQPSGPTRPPPIRRPLRSARTTDFSDFTSRRRLSQRPDSLDSTNHPRPSLSDTPPVTHARRFFPSNRSHHLEHSGSFPWQNDVESQPPDSAVDTTPSHPLQTANESEIVTQPNLTLPPIESYQLMPPERNTNFFGRLRVLPLRRGSVRPPESISNENLPESSVEPPEDVLHDTGGSVYDEWERRVRPVGSVL